MIKCELTITAIKTMIRVLDHARSQATNSGGSGYSIDELCRKDCVARFWELRSYLNGRLPKKSRFT